MFQLVDFILIVFNLNSSFLRGLFTCSELVEPLLVSVRALSL